jgi:cyclic beta-1,2-glucan synthetase
VKIGFPESGLGLPGVPDRAKEDPGYYLVSRGRRAFERRLGFRVPWRIQLYRTYRVYREAIFLAEIAALTAILLTAGIFLTWTTGAGLWILVLLGILGLVPASDMAVSLVYRLVAVLVPPTVLPKLDLTQGVPAELRTLVVVPTLLTSLTDIKEQLERLEVHYLANPEGHLHFALLTDWADAPRECMPEDQDLLAAAADGIARLNKRYGSFCCIVDVSGTSRKANGSAGKESEGNSTS